MTLDITRILVPLDFSTHSARALDCARDLALKFGAALHLVHVCELPSMMTASMDAYSSACTDWSQRLGEEAERELTRSAAALGDIKVTTSVLFGNAPLGIVDAAAISQADLIVMGTHGHGALMPVLMGNVAERVVRTAPCPVLTVGEPRPDHRRVVPNSRPAGIGATIVVAAALFAPGGVANASAQAVTQSTPGESVYATYCAACHGPAARGDGPLASSMTRKPANLTEIARRNGGPFPSDLVFRIIDGRQPVRGHGGPDMPAWGDVFKKSRDAGDEERVKAVIQSLVDYLESLQSRPAQQ